MSVFFFIFWTLTIVVLNVIYHGLFFITILTYLIAWLWFSWRKYSVDLHRTQLISIWSVLHIKISIFEPRSPMSCTTVSFCSLSMPSINLTSSFGGLNTSIKHKKEMMSKILSFTNLTDQFNGLKML